MMIYKCTCGAVSYTENDFKCQICGEHTIGFKLPSLNDKPGIDFKGIAYWVGVGCMFVGIAAFIFLGCLFGK